MTFTVFAAFLLGVILSALINIVTAWVNREYGKRLMPWMVFYIAVHGAYVAVTTDPVRGFAMSEARSYHGWSSYVVVMLIAAALAAVLALRSGRRGCA